MVRRLTGKMWAAAMTGALILSMSFLTIASAQDGTPAAGAAPYTPPDNIGDLSGRIVADGSSTVVPITEAVAEEFRAIAPNVEAEVSFSGTGGGFERFCNGETDLQDASRPIREDEVANCRTAGVDYWEFQVAYDGLSIVVNPANDFLDCITVEQLKQLWIADSTVDSWNDLNPDWPDTALPGDDLYGAGTDSGTYDYFVEAIIGEGSTRTDFNPSEDDNQLVEGVAGNENALGFFGLAYYLQNQDRLKLVAVDGGNGCVLPTKDTVSDGSYAPLSRPLFVYVKAESLARPEVQEFMRFYIANAAVLSQDVGYVDSPADVYVSDQAKLEGAIAGTAEPDGPGDAEASPTA